MKSSVFLKRIGVASWRAFEERAYRDDNVLARGDKPVPVWADGDTIRYNPTEHGGDTYVQFVAYRFSPSTFLVAATYLPMDKEYTPGYPKSFYEECRLFFFDYVNKRFTKESSNKKRNKYLRLWKRELST